MIKNYSIVLISSFFILTACGNQTDDESEPVEQAESIAEQKEEIYSAAGSMDEHYLRLIERDEPVWAGISHSSSFGGISTDYFVEITDSDTLQFIVDEMIEGSQREIGIVDMAEPYYGMKLEYADDSEEVFHLWVTEDEESIGTIMDSEETHFIYTFPKSVSDEFLSLLPEDSIIDSPI